MDCLSVFNPSRHLISSFIIFYFLFITHVLHFFSFFFFLFSTSSLLFFLFQIWLQEKLRLLHPLTVPLNTYLLRHLKDHWLRDAWGFEAYIELMGRLKETDIQWVVEWWHISIMVHSCYKDHCVTLVGLRCNSYYSTCHISRQFEKCQGAPTDEGAFHTAMFINRILGRITEGWPHRKVTKDIVPPKYFYPTVSCKQ